MINNTKIEDRVKVINADIIKVRQKLAELDQQKVETIALMNALTGAKQQCEVFLKEIDDVEPKEIDDVEPEVVSDSSDVD